MLNGRAPGTGRQLAPELVPIPIPVEDGYGRPMYPPGYPQRGGAYGGGNGGYGGYGNYYGMTIEQIDDTNGSMAKKQVPLFSIRGLNQNLRMR